MSRPYCVLISYIFLLGLTLEQVLLSRSHADQKGESLLAFKEGAQHPSHFFVLFHQAGQEVRLCLHRETCQNIRQYGRAGLRITCS